MPLDSLAPPRVTVVIAAYRDHEYFDATVRSALEQEFDHFEVIISDDSPSRATYPGYARHARDPRLRYRHNEQRLGPAGNHWAAFRAAQAPFVAILNHDDLLRPGHLAAMVPPLEGDETIGASFCDHDIIDARGELLAEVTARQSRQYGRDRLAPHVHRDLRSLVLGQTMPMAIGSVVRRSMLLGRPLPNIVGGAYDLYLSVLLAAVGAAVYYEPARLSAWRVHEASLTNSADPSWLYGAAYAWRFAASSPVFASERSDLIRRAARSFAVAGKAYLARRNWRQVAHAGFSAVESLASAWAPETSSWD